MSSVGRKDFRRKPSRLITIDLAIFLVLGGVWVVASDAYAEPEEALVAHDP